MSGKKKLFLVAGILVIVVAVGGAAGWYLLESGNATRQEPGSMPEMENGFGEDMVAASGSTSVGMQEETFGLDYIETELEVEEVYLSTQQEVEEGTAILKLTDESIKLARRELEEKATEAELNYREALLDGEEEKVTAQQTLDTSLLNGTYASYTYDESLNEYEEQIESLQEQIEEAQELVDEYTASIETDYYYTYYEVAEKKEAYESTFSALMTLYEEWDVATLEDHNQASSIGGTSQGEGGASGTGEGGMAGGMGGNTASNDSTKLTVYDMLDEEVQENEAAYEEALENYETAKKTAESSLAQAQSNLELLNTQLEEAQIAYEQQQVSSQSDYDSAIESSNSAQETYETEISRIEDEISVAENAKEEAEENLQEFEDLIGDGYLYTTSAGTVMMVGVYEEMTLTGGNMILAYSQPDAVTVTASVSQEDIASIEVGEEAVVVVSEAGTYEGVVESINPISNSNSRSNVSYSVVVELTGDVSGLSANLSATVYFGASMADEEGGVGA